MSNVIATAFGRSRFHVEGTARRPRRPGPLVGGFADIALRDFGLLLGALSVSRLASIF